MDKLGEKHDQDKLRYDLVPPGALQSVATVLTYGSKKYSDENWREVPDAKRRYYAAMMRHMELWRQGEMFDKESVLPHLGHAATCAMFLLSLEQDEESWNPGDL